MTSNKAPTRRDLSGRTQMLVLSAFAGTVGLINILWWILFGGAFLHPLLGSASTKVASGLAILLGSLAVLAWLNRRPRSWSVGLAVSCAAVGAVALIEGLIANWGIDPLQRLDRQGDRNLLLALPGWNTSIAFILIGLSLGLLFVGVSVRAAQVLAAASALISYLAVIGNAMLVDVIFPDSLWTQMALTTSVPCFALSLAALLIRPSQGFMGDFTSRWLGSRVAQILIYVTLLVGLILAISVRFMVYLDIPRPIPAQIIVALLVPAMVLLAGYIAIRVNRMDEQRTRLNTIDTAISNSMQGVLILNGAGEISQANDAAATLLALGRDEIVGRRLEDFVPEGAQSSHTAHDRAKSAGNELTATPAESTELRDALGRTRPIDISFSRLPTDEGGDTIVATIRDTSALVRANKELEQFAYVASHDLRAPLRTVSGFAELLEMSFEDGELDDEKREILTMLLGGVERMRALIDALLAYSRLGREMDPASCSVLETVEGALASLLTDIEGADAFVQVNIDPDLEWRVDESLVISALMNIVQNSIKYRPDDRGLRIIIEGRAKGRMVSLTITDNGNGIAPGQLDRATQMFQRLTVEKEGLGIGLASVKRAVEHNGGTFGLASDGKSYTAASIVLPRGTVGTPD